MERGVIEVVLTMRHQDTGGFVWHLRIPRCEAAVRMATHELLAFMLPSDRPQCLHTHTHTHTHHCIGQNGYTRPACLHGVTQSPSTPAHTQTVCMVPSDRLQCLHTQATCKVLFRMVTHELLAKRVSPHDHPHHLLFVCFIA